MAFCIIAGIEVPCRPDTTQDDETFRLGFEGEAFAGNLRSTVYAEKRRWTLTTAKWSRTQLNALRAAVANGVTVSMSGDIVDGTPVNVKVRIREAPWHIAMAPMWQSATITVKEI